MSSEHSETIVRLLWIIPVLMRYLKNQCFMASIESDISSLGLMDIWNEESKCWESCLFEDLSQAAAVVTAPTLLEKKDATSWEEQWKSGLGPSLETAMGVWEVLSQLQPWGVCTEPGPAGAHHCLSCLWVAVTWRLASHRRTLNWLGWNYLKCYMCSIELRPPKTRRNYRHAQATFPLLDFLFFVLFALSIV